MNGNDAPNVKDLRETVFECARTFLTDVSATEIAELVVDEIETADCLELIDDGTTWERVTGSDDVELAMERFDRSGQWAA